jgi:hypothetical protein
VTQDACPECGAAMEEGFIPDTSHAAVVQLAWQRGIPQNRRFLGLKTGTVKFNESQCLKITARRCTGCGLLKLYARPTSD